MLVRGDSLAAGMSQYLVERIESAENIEVRLGASVAEVRGTDRLQELVIQSKTTGELETVPAAGLFVFAAPTHKQARAIFWRGKVKPAMRGGVSGGPGHIACRTQLM